jgi:hypothetical protein
VVALLLALAVAAAPAPAAPESPAPGQDLDAAADRARAALLARHGEGQRARIERGVAQVRARWRPSDGPPAELEALLRQQFLADDADLLAALGRLEEALEVLDGRLLQVNRSLARHAALDVGPRLPVDVLLASWDAGAHLDDDLHASRIAFVALLNFPLTTLEERLGEGPGWSRRRWAEARLLGRRGSLVGTSDAGLGERIPSAVRQRMARAYAVSGGYVADYNLWAHHLLDGSGERLFPSGKRLLAHWNVRDEVKAWYGQPGALPRQRALARALERIAAQEIPAAVVNSPRVDWNPFTNEVRPAPASAIEGGAPPPREVDPAREPDTRYAFLLESVHALRAADPFLPGVPTAIDRRFAVDLEMPQARVEAILEEILSSPLLARVAREISRRLGRPLEPFDVWYGGFTAPAIPEARVDERTRRRYPDAAAFHADMPRMLRRLGFAPARARWIVDHVVVEPARGSGHAMPAAIRDDRPHLRTRFGPGGMDAKGYDIAVHEMGHSVEQVLSLWGVDHTLLSGVPDYAFTEAIAFAFQARGRELLGLPGGAGGGGLRALQRLWDAFEMAGVSLVDLRTVEWIYRHPDAGPAELREAVLGIARETWNRWYAPVLGVRDSTLLAVYSHMVQEPLYLSNYALGYVVTAQLEERFTGAGRLGPELERMTRTGSLPPDAWMRAATGESVSPRALLQDAERALGPEPR